MTKTNISGFHPPLIYQPKITFECQVDNTLRNSITQYISDYYTECDGKQEYIIHSGTNFNRTEDIGYLICEVWNSFAGPVLWIDERHYIYRPGSLMPIGNVSTGEYAFDLGMPCLYYSQEKLDKLMDLDSTKKKTNSTQPKIIPKIDPVAAHVSQMKSPIRWIYDILKKNTYNSYFSTPKTMNEQHIVYTKWCQKASIEAKTKIGWSMILFKFYRKTKRQMIYSTQKKINGRNVKVLNILPKSRCKTIFNIIYGVNMF